MNGATQIPVMVLRALEQIPSQVNAILSGSPNSPPSFETTQPVISSREIFTGTGTGASNFAEAKTPDSRRQVSNCSEHSDHVEALQKSYTYAELLEAIEGHLPTTIERSQGKLTRNFSGNSNSNSISNSNAHAQTDSQTGTSSSNFLTGIAESVLLTQIPEAFHICYYKKLHSVPETEWYKKINSSEITRTSITALIRQRAFLETKVEQIIHFLSEARSKIIQNSAQIENLLKDIAHCPISEMMDLQWWALGQLDTLPLHLLSDQELGAKYSEEELNELLKFPQAFYEKSADLGCSYGQLALAEMYWSGDAQIIYQGNRVRVRDYHQAQTLLAKASLQNLAQAQYRLGWLYNSNYDKLIKNLPFKVFWESKSAWMKPGKEEAQALFSSAAQQWHAKAQLALEELHQEANLIVDHVSQPDISKT